MYSVPGGLGSGSEGRGSDDALLRIEFLGSILVCFTGLCVGLN